VKIGEFFGYADKNGRVVVPAQYQEARRFPDGRAAVKLAGRWGFINYSGRLVVQPIYDWADNFHKGRARVILHEQEQQIDRHGRNPKLGRSGARRLFLAASTLTPRHGQSRSGCYKGSHHRG
jgi:hypothetical protein